MATNNAFSGTIELEAGQIADIQHALLIGLTLYGDFLERLNAVDTLRICGTSVPDELIPVDPTGSVDAVTVFANALRFISQPVAKVAGEGA